MQDVVELGGTMDR